MKVLSRVAVALLLVWLLCWIVVFRFSILDDSLIHLRYAAYLRSVHFITFDGVDRTFGTSSLLFVGLLAFLRGFTTNPLMPRAVSSACHLLLFAAFAWAYLRTATASRRVHLLGLTALFLLVPLSAIRWLDDGMETSLVLCLVCLTAWWVHRLSLRTRVTAADWAVSALLGFLLVLLRNELAVVALLGVAILALTAPAAVNLRGLPRTLPARSGLLAGGLLTALAIRLVMHTFLPDTALAKSHGIHHFGPTLGASEQVMAGSLIFGLGAFCLWLLSAAMLLRHRQARRLPTLAANALFPIVLLAAATRGQEIQGVRYLIWTFFFSIVWNFLELWTLDRTVPPAVLAHDAALWSPARDPLLLGALLVLLLLALPTDTRLIRRILTLRGQTTRDFMAVDLATALRGQTGVAFDVGYIAYFSQASICDLNGLINGAAPAALTVPQRAQRCAAQRPTFAYLNKDQDRPLSTFLDIHDWRLCGQYDLPNIRTTDRHYLLVRPQDAPRVCAANRFPPAPSPFR